MIRHGKKHRWNGDGSGDFVCLRIEFRQGSSAELSAEFGTFRLVVIGRAFHWMERHETPQHLRFGVNPITSPTNGAKASASGPGPQPRSSNREVVVTAQTCTTRRVRTSA
jgi:hypothetical protein